MLTDEKQAIKIFSLTNTVNLGICGYHAVNKKDTTYSEFLLFQCGHNEAIDVWDATQTCIINKARDTLFVKELFGLPIAKNFTIKWVPFYINKYYLKDRILKQEKNYRTDLEKYSEIQIQKVLDEYKKLKKGNNYEHMLVVARMLFWAYVSGSKEAEVYLNTIQKKFGPFDGGISEEWGEIHGTYEHWKKLNNNK